MPNYAITSVYQPFSFQERITPLVMMKEEQDKIGEAIANYSNDSNTYYNYLDPNARAVVDRYNETLNSVANSLASDGLKSVSRNTLFDLKRMYNNQIAPINKAAESYASLQEQVRKMSMQDPTLMVANMPTVSDLMANPNAMPSTLSGATLYKQGTLAASQLSDVTYEQLERYLAGDKTAIPNIDSITAQIGDMYGVGKLSEDGQRQALGYIAQGMKDGLSARTAEMSALNNKLAMQHQYDLEKIWAQNAASRSLANYKTNESIRLAERKAELSAQSKGSGSRGTTYGPQAKHSIYFKGDNSYTYDKEIQEAKADSKMTARSFMNLSPENKKKALEYMGIDTSGGIDKAILDNWDTINLDYTYLEYNGNGRKRDQNEFMIIPTNRARDVSTGVSNDWISTEDLLMDDTEE